MKWKASLGFWLIILGLTLFWAGRNNNDVCRNELAINYQINQILAENNISWRYNVYELDGRGSRIGLNECHSSSLAYLQIGSLMMLIGGLIFGNATRN